jgi:arginase
MIECLKPRGLTRAWLHIDLDVLDQSVMPPVDSPGTPELS